MPSTKISVIDSQGLGVNCLTPNDIFLSSEFIDNTFAFTFSPIENNSEGCLICCVQLISLI